MGVCGSAAVASFSCFNPCPSNLTTTPALEWSSHQWSSPATQPPLPPPPPTEPDAEGVREPGRDADDGCDATAQC